MKTLTFTSLTSRTLKFSADAQRLMRRLWQTKKSLSKNPQLLGEYYAQAFAAFLYKNRIPKAIAKVSRQATRMYLPEQAVEDLKGMEKIARKRQQTLAVVIEEAVTEYLAKPENYLGSNEYKSQKTERMG